LQFFEVFGLNPQFRMNMKALDAAYRQQQALTHPDKFAHTSDSERRSSEQRSALINDAYSALKDPVRRAAYLIENICGVDPFAQTNTKMPAAFLIEQMEMRETLQSNRAAKSVDLLEALRVRVETDFEASESMLAAAIDVQRDMAIATVEARKLRFHQKLLAEIDDAFD
jgi:molecular chaperone HscB